MKKIIIAAAIIFTAGTVQSQSTEAGKNISKLCGCFEVEFKYAETFSPDANYKYHNREEIAAGLELALPIEVSEKKISIQHLLVVNDQMIVKHWREDWVYEPSFIWKYKGDMTWVKEALSAEQVKGKWMQTVWEVSDAPRYQGISEWINTDNKTFWQNTADAPLPRREYSTRSDYNILRRTNRLVVTEQGWIHEQDNQKILRKSGTDQLLVEEKGINSYKKTADKDCAAAQAWWNKNSEYWAKVRTAWDSYIASHAVIALKENVEGKPLHQYLSDLSKEYASKKIKPAEIEVQIKNVLEKYFREETVVAQAK